MTPESRNVGSILVRASTTPSVERCSVDVRPGIATTFAGDRPRDPFHVTVSDHGVHETYSRDRFVAVVSAVGRLLREHDATVVRLGNRRHLASFRPASTVRDLERRIAAGAAAEGATLLTWTDGELRPDDPSIYDRIVELPDEEGVEEAPVLGGPDEDLVEGRDARSDHPP